jgi:CPA1 family monovalent cation:H+ antiporter
MSVELTVLAILVAAALLLIASQFTRVPYPILLVIGGLGLGFAPGLPDVELDPEVVLVAILPPLLY